MKKNGYTLIELLILIAGLGLVALFAIPKMSKAFDNNNDSLYETNLKLYLTQAELYGKDNKSDIKKAGSLVTSIDDLVKAGYISGDESGKVIDVRDDSVMNAVKIELVYNSEDDSIKAQIVN